MSDVPKSPEEPEDSGGSTDPIARLVRLAGPRPPAPEKRMARVRESVHARWREAVKRARRRRVFLTAARIAAALMIAVGAGFWLRGRIRVAAGPAATVVRTQGRVLLRDGRVAGTGSVLGTGAGLATGPDGRAALRLSVGPSVRLDTGTDLRLISARVLELRRGAVYVDTGTRTSRGSAATAGGAAGSASTETAAPIEIRTSLGRVRDLGTQFEVRLANDTLRLSVREGTVALARDDRTYPTPAGTRLRVGPQGSVETETVDLRGAEWDWVLAAAPPFDLEGRTLSDYLAWLSRETGWEVEYADPSIAAGAATIILHGSTSGLRPDESPAAILPACGLRHRLEGGMLRIERAADERRPE